MSADQIEAESATFLIVEGDVLVAEDIAQIIQLRFPRARIVSTRTLDRATMALRGMAAPRMAFVAAAPAEVAQCDVALRGAFVVLMGHAGETAQGSWPVLRYPFTTADVEAHLARCLPVAFAA